MACSIHDKLQAKGARGSVVVNQRDLIDKMLARYASDFVVVRELVQNADDAKATNVCVKFESPNEISATVHKTLMTKLVVSNNGRSFTSKDWERVARIAEGNPDEDSVGMFGVGFYSVFSLTDRPVIHSGGRVMGFFWAGSQLETRSLDLTHESSTNDHATYTELPFVEPRTWDMTSLFEFLCRALCFTKTVSVVSVTLNGEEIFRASKELLNSKALTGVNTTTVDEGEYGKLRVVEAVHSTLSLTVSLAKQNLICKESLSHVHATIKSELTPAFLGKTERVLKKRLPDTTQIHLLLPTSKCATGPSAAQRGVLAQLNPICPQQAVPRGRVFVGLATHQTTGTCYHVHAQLIPTIERENVDFQDPYLGQWNVALLRVAARVVRVVYASLLTSAPGHHHNKHNKKNFDLAMRVASVHESAPSKVVADVLREGFFSQMGPDFDVPCWLPGANVAIRPVRDVFFPNAGVEQFVDCPVACVVGCLEGAAQFSSNEADWLPLWRHLSATGVVRRLSAQQIESFLESEASAIGEDIALRFLCWASDPEVQKSEGKANIKRLLAKLRWGAGDAATKVCQFSKIKLFAACSGQEACRAANLPLPPNVLSMKMSRRLTEQQLQALALQRVPPKTWLAHVLSTVETWTASPKAVHSVLAYLGGVWGDLNSADVARLKGRLGAIRCMPTNKGVRAPSDCVLPGAATDSDAAVVSLPLLAEDERDMDAIEIDDDSNSESDHNGRSLSTAAEDALPPVRRVVLQHLGVRSSVCLVSMLADHRNRHTTASAGANTSSACDAILQKLAAEFVAGNLGPHELESLRSSKLLPARVRGNLSPELMPPVDLLFRSTSEIESEPVLSFVMPVLEGCTAQAGTPEHNLLVQLGVHMFPPLEKLLSFCAEPTTTDAHLRAALSFLFQNVDKHYPTLDRTKCAYLPCTPPSTFQHNSIPLAPVVKRRRGQKHATSTTSTSTTSTTTNNNRSTKPAPNNDSDIIFCSPASCVVLPCPLTPSLCPWVVRLAAEHLASSDCAINLDDEDQASDSATSIWHSLTPQLLDSVFHRRLGVRASPTPSAILQALAQNPPGSQQSAVSVFEYLHDHMDVRPDSIKKLQSVSFIPSTTADGAVEILRPPQVFLANPCEAGGEDEQTAPTKNRSANRLRKRARSPVPPSPPSSSQMQPVNSTLDPSVMALIVPFVDFGTKANAFLRLCKVEPFPTADNLLSLAADSMARVMKTHGADAVAQVLTRLCAELPAIKSPTSSTKGKKFLLACRLEEPAPTAPTNPSTEKQIDGELAEQRYSAPKLIVAGECFLVDDARIEQVVRPWVLPPHLSKLEPLYKAAGCRWLTSAAQVQYVPKGKPVQQSNSTVCEQIRRLVSSRAPLLVRDARGVRCPRAQPEAESMLEKVSVVAVHSIQMTVTFQGDTHVFTDPRDVPQCALVPKLGGKPTICIVAHNQALPADLYDVACCVGKIIFGTLGEDCDRILGLLSQPLNTLRRRGLPVSRLMHNASISHPTTTTTTTTTMNSDDDDDDDVVAHSGPQPQPVTRGSAATTTTTTTTTTTKGGTVRDFRAGARSLEQTAALLRHKPTTITHLATNESVREEFNHHCEARGSVDLSLHTFEPHVNIPHGIRLFLDSEVRSVPSIEYVMAFANVLGAVGSALGMSAQHKSKTFSMFVDVTGSCIAFNHQGSIFFNLRYFIQIHAPQIKRNSEEASRCVYSFWFVTACHEVAHNGESAHNSLHEDLMETLLATHLHKLAQFCEPLQLPKNVAAGKPKKSQLPPANDETICISD